MLLEFYGETCPHCLSMKPLVEKTEKDLGVEIKKFEVWNNEDNAAEMAKYDKGLCGGVPFYYNTDSKQFICGATDEASFVSWAKGEATAGSAAVE